jgi:hypothetical protein
MAKDILKEAIADAKAVREVALANAKAALEEAFTPKLQSMLSAKLSEELDEEMYDEDEDSMDEMMYDEDEDSMDEMDLDIDMSEIEDEGMDEDYGEEDSTDEEIDLEEILNELELEEDEAIVDEDEQLEEQRPIYKAEYANDPTYKADHVHESEEFDLDALLKEINSLDEGDTRPFKKGNAPAEPTAPLPNPEGDFGEGQINESLFAAIGGLVGLLGAAGTTAAIESALEDPAVAEKYPKLAKVFEFLSKIGNSGLTKGIKQEDMTYDEDDKSEELEETKKALATVRAELNEVNLLNSKLLYVNRIFKANNLDESQKLRVVETLDKAGSTKEAKLIYETIKDTFYVAKSKKASFKTKTKSLKEGIGMASKAVGTSTAPKKEIISESNNMVNRFQKLANITINE